MSVYFNVYRRRPVTLSIEDLVNIVSTKYSAAEIRRRPIPNGFCYVCNGIDELGKYKNPHTHLFSKGFFKHCEHQPKTPYPTAAEYDTFYSADDVNDGRHCSPNFNDDDFILNRENSDSQLNFNVKVSVKKRSPEEPEKYSKKYFNSSSEDPDKYSKKYFNTSVLKGNRYEDYDDTTFYKLPPVFDSGYHSNSTDRDSGKLVPRISEKTFDDAAKIVDDEPDENYDDETEIISEKEESVNLPPIVTRRKSIQSDNKDEGYSERSEEHTRSDGFETTNESLSVSETESIPSRTTTQVTLKENTIDKSPDKSPEKAMIIKRVSTTPQWCTCAEPDFTKMKCPDCKQVNGHDKWCLHSKSPTKQNVCVNCGKPIKFLPERSFNSPERRMSRSTSNHECESRHSSPIKRTSDIRQTSPIKKKEQKVVHFEDKPQVKETSKSVTEPLTRDPTDEDFLDISNVIYDESGKMWVPTEDFSRDFEATDPNIHRDAYLKALRAVRNQTLKKIVEIDEKFIRDRITRPFVFSYFKLLPAQKNALPDGPRDIGIKPDMSKGVPPRKAMKHIFKKVNVNDYYPGGKGNPGPGGILSLQEEKHRQTMPIHKLKWKNR